MRNSNDCHRFTDKQVRASVTVDTTTIKLTNKLSKRQENISTTYRQTFFRHDSPTLRVLIFFPTAQKFLKFYCQPTLAHLPLPPTSQANTRAKSKEPILPTLYLKTVS